MPNPLVSICVPTYNRAAALQESFKSILAQDYAPLEILISDNCSDDDTEAVCRRIEKADSRVRYVRQPRNLGLYGNHNFCFNESRGEFIAIFHDHDDRSPQLISESVAFLSRHPEAGVVCSDWELINQAGERIGVRDAPVQAITPGLDFIGQTIRSGRSSIGVPGALIRRSALGDIRLDEDAPIGFADFVVWFRLAERVAVGHIPKRLWRWRQERGSQSARTIESQAHDYYQNLTAYCDDHLTRWPEHADLVARWKADIRRYLFWALAFELGLHFRHEAGPPSKRPAALTLFEIMDYRLSEEQFRRVLYQLRAYRHGAFQHAALMMIEFLMRLKLTQPLAWLTYRHTWLRSLFGLR